MCLSVNMYTCVCMGLRPRGCLHLCGFSRLSVVQMQYFCFAARKPSIRAGFSISLIRSSCYISNRMRRETAHLHTLACITMRSVYKDTFGQAVRLYQNLVETLSTRRQGKPSPVSQIQQCIKCSKQASKTTSRVNPVNTFTRQTQTQKNRDKPG